MKKWISIGLGVLFFAFSMSAYAWIDEYEEAVMAIAKSTFEFITGFEGKRNSAYKDSKGLWTTGVGHLIKPNEPHLLKAKLTDDQVEDLFNKDIEWCANAVDSSVRVPLTQNQFDALYSLCFNIGETNFRKSSVLRKLNAGDYHGAADAFLMWNKPAILTGRRQKERAHFLQDI